MIDVPQELMTPHEASRWFRRSPSWLRQQGDLLRVGGNGAQPLYHVQVCRAYVMGRLCGLTGAELRRAQLAALASACGLSQDAQVVEALALAGNGSNPVEESVESGDPDLRPCDIITTHGAPN